MPDTLEAEFADALDRWNEEEHRWLTLMVEADHDLAESTSEVDHLHLAAMLETMRREARESKGRVAAVLSRVDGDA